MNSYKKVLFEKREDCLVLIRINNPKRRNALDLSLRQELYEALVRASKDDEIRVIILTGVGQDFCAGGDIKSWGDFSPQDARDRMKAAGRAILQIMNIEKPVLAMVHGFAVGGGMNLALACDLIIASEDAVFAQSQVLAGLIPDAGGLYFLPRLIGSHLAKDLMFTGRRISAIEAARLGIVKKVVPRDRLEEETIKIGISLAEGPSYAIGLIKILLNKGLDASFPVLLELEANAQALCFNSKENKEGMSAFLGKRKPNFRNLNK